MAEQTQPQFSIRFWGVRGSIAVPGPGTVRYGGNTLCIEIRVDGHVVMLDAGTGARALGASLAEETGGRVRASILFSHMHSDHIAGFPFFAPIYSADTALTLYGDGTKSVGCEGALRRQMSFPLFPVEFDELAASIAFVDITPGVPFDLFGATITTCPLNHPGGALAYRIEHHGHVFVHASDVEHLSDTPEPELVELCRGADVITYDAMYVEGESYDSHRGWGHSTWQAGMRLADSASASRLVAVHHAPEHDDDTMDRIAAMMEQARPGSLVAREGMAIDLLTGAVTG